MGKEEILRDILFKVSELKMDVETAEKKIHRLFNDSGSFSAAFVAGAEWMEERLSNKL
jgi:hypothetical protein